MSYGYIGDTSTSIKQQVKNQGVLSMNDVQNLKSLGQWGGSLELIEEQTVSSASAVNFTNLKGDVYDVHLITVSNLTYASSNDNTSIRVSNDGGSSYESGSNYQFAIQYASQVAGFQEYKSTGTTKYDIGLLGGDNTNEAVNFYAYIYNANDSSKFTFMLSHGTTFSDTTHHGQGMFFGSGVYNVAEKIDAFTLFGDTGGTMANAVIKLYGIKKI